MGFSIGVSGRAPKTKKKPYYDRIQEYIKKAQADGPEGFKSFVQGSSAWAFIPSEDMFVQTAMQGIGVAIGFAFIVVLFATGNIVNTFIAIFCVGTVILSITACFYIGGQ